ncbi:MAG: shikimate kinase [Candidatus Paceibacteria bacterium]
MKTNILLIGMPGVGKTFNAKILSQKLGFPHISVDDMITAGALEMGIENKRKMPDPDFVALENKMLLSLQNIDNSVIDTGASAIYSKEAMDILRNTSLVVYLHDDISKIKERFENRGKIHLIGMKNEDTPFEQIFNERESLYEYYADLKLDVSEHRENIPDEIIRAFKNL